MGFGGRHDEDWVRERHRFHIEIAEKVSEVWMTDQLVFGDREEHRRARSARASLENERSIG
jgi:hypothetical protein